MPDDENDFSPGDEGMGDSSTDESSAGSFFAACDSGGNHPAWVGPNRSTRQAAQDDADRHNETCDATGAVVVS